MLLLTLLYKFSFAFQHLFSAVRAKGGHSDHPTVRQASGAIRTLAANAFLRRGFSSHCNVEEEVQAVSSPDFPSLHPTTQVQVVIETSAQVIDEEDLITADVASLPTVVERLAQHETLAYVCGALLRRLGCEACREKMTSADPPRSTGFTGLMTFTSATMIAPTEMTVKAFGDLLTPVLAFFEHNFHLPNVVAKCVRKLKLDSRVGCCSQSHVDKLLVYFSRMLLHVFCKEKNADLQMSKKRKSHKYLKLNV